jgi:predicted CXXCH cytochrome family protein
MLFLMLQLPNNHVSKSEDGVMVSGGIQTGATYVNTSLPANDCSGCHPDNWDGWSATKHAWAWPTLMNSTLDASNRQTCEVCHSTGAGQPSIYPNTGYSTATNGPTYLQNVTCQSCHGPASNHIAASGTVAKQENISMLLNASLCGSCHTSGGNLSSSHHPTYSEWEVSGHNTSSTIRAIVGGNPQCANCHEAWDAMIHVQTGLYRNETRIAGEDAAEVWEISCAVCHDPHSLGTANTQLRLPADQICQRCHTQEDAAPGVAVHHPQAEVRDNTAGYLADRTDLTYMEGMACSKCHMAEDNAGLPNHTFNPNPYSCVTCHGAPDFPDNATAQAYINKIATGTVENITAAQPYVDQAAELIEQMMGNRSNVLNTYRDQYNISLFNLDTVINDKSSGNHNPPLASALLSDSLGKAMSVIANLTAPDKVLGVTVTAGEGGSSIVINWTASNATDFAKYRLYVLTTSTGNLTSVNWTHEINSASTTNYTVEGLDFDTYYVYVTAVDTNGNEITNPLTGKSVTLSEEEEEPDGGGISAEILAGIVILVAAIVILIAALMMRKKKGPEPAEPEKTEE